MLPGGLSKLVLNCFHSAQLSMVAEQKQKSASVHANKLREESDMLKRTKEE